jgi:hypothetical protein
VYIDESFDVAFHNRRRFDVLSYTIDNEYIPDLIETEQVKVSAFEIEGNKSKIWLTYTDAERAKNKTPNSRRGNIQITFGEPPNPIGLTIESGETGKTCQVHRMIAKDFVDVKRELLATGCEYDTEVYYVDGRRRTISLPENMGNGKYLTDASLESQQCYLGYYGLDEPAFARAPKGWPWKTIGLCAMTCLSLICIWLYRNRNPKFKN